MNKTKIPWCDWTWNPIVGCSPASEGCANCYAAAISKRFHLPWGSPVLMEDRLNEPEKVKKPGKVFVCSMADIGHEGVRDEWRQVIINAMRRAPWHTFIILTKRPGPWMLMLPERCWMGVTIESGAYWMRWVELTKVTPVDTVRFVSVEPMLGPVSFAGLPEDVRPDWVIAGPETGPKARECRAEWIEALAAESKCFFDKREVRREWPK